MYTAEDMLREYSIAVLRSSACRDVSFTVSKITVVGYLYGYVADLLANGSIAVAIKTLPSPLNAQYSNVPGGSAQLAFNPSFANIGYTWDHKSSIVHEATHAGVNVTNVGQNVDSGVDEVAAYLAEFIYSAKAKITMIPSGPLYKPLSVLADRVMNFRGDGICVLTDSDIAEARNIILNSYRSAGLATGVSTMQPIKPKPVAGPPMVPDP